MAVIKRGILGGFQNKIGNVVGSSWKGISTMRSLPISVANPRTSAQVAQRSKFTFASQYASSILASTIKPLWDRFAQQESGYNAWIRSNIAGISNNGEIDESLMSMSKGALAPLTIIGITWINNSQTLQLMWETSVVGDGSPDDDVYLVVFSSQFDKFFAYPAIVKRSAGSVSINLPEDLSGASRLVAWLSARRVDGTKVSDSTVDSVSVIA